MQSPSGLVDGSGSRLICDGGTALVGTRSLIGSVSAPRGIGIDGVAPVGHISHVFSLVIGVIVYGLNSAVVK